MEESANPATEIRDMETLSWAEKKKLISEIDRLSLNEISIPELEDLLSPIIKGTTLMMFPFPTGLSLFRAIKYTDKPLRWENIIYPPEECTKWNRASEPGEQLFYCSTVKKAPFYELELQAGDRLVLANWINTLPLFLNCIGYNLEEIMALSAVYHAPVRFDGIDRDQLMNENNVFSNAYFKSAFSRRIETEEYHKLTIAIARKFNAGNPTGQEGSSTPFAGMIYHTSRLDDTADNIALKPNVIDVGLLELQKLEFIEILSVENDKYRYRILDYAESVQNGNIKWYNLENSYTLDDESDDAYFVLDGTEVNLYNSEGDVIDPD